VLLAATPMATFLPVSMSSTVILFYLPSIGTGGSGCVSRSGSASQYGVSRSP